MAIGQNLQTLPVTNNNGNIQVVQSELAEGGLELGHLWAALRRKAFLILSITVAVAAAAGLKALYDPPKYVGNFEVLVQPMTPEDEVVSSLPDALTGDAKRTALNTALPKILASRKVLLPVIHEMRSLDSEFCQKMAPLNVAAKLPSTMKDEDCYAIITASLVIQKSTSGGLIGGDSNIIEVSYTGFDDKTIKAFLDRLSQAFLDYSLDSRQADVRRGIEFVEKKLPDLRQRVETLQDQLQQLRLTYNLITPDATGSQISGQVGAFTQQQLDAQVQLDQAQALYTSLVQQLAQQPTQQAASSALKENPRYQTLLGKLLDLNSQMAQSSTLYLKDSPDMQMLLEQRQNLLQLLAQEGTQSQREIINQIRELETKQQALQQTIDSLNGGVRELSGISRVYADIQRELEISTQNLNQFLAKREALQIDAAQREVPWELLTPPTEPQPFPASLPTNLILGALLGLLIGTGVALALDKSADTIHTTLAFKRLVNYPLLGSIPRNQALQQGSGSKLLTSLQQFRKTLQSSNGKGGRDRYGQAYSMPPFIEAFRSLFANIQLISADAPIRSLVVSSVVPGEGKSTVAACLAEAAAALGKRVLLVDTDLRHPRLHDYLNLPNTQGLTEVMSGTVPLRDGIQRSPLDPNMFVLTAGEAPQDPARFLSSQKMQYLMEQVQNSFDFVIYDTPPLLGFADVYLMAKHTHGILLVSQLSKVKRSQLLRVLDQLHVSGTPILGVVLQKLPST